MHRFGLLASTIVLASCTDTTAPVEDLTAIRVEVRAAPAAIVVGQLATITVTLTNTKPWRVSIAECPIYYTVEDTAGVVVGGSEGVGCFGYTREALVYRPLVFRPFETKTFSFDWLVPENLPPGDYDAFGWVNSPQYASPAVSITVLPAN